MRITFEKTHRVQQHDGLGPVYDAGETYAFDGVVAETYARKYVRLGLAVEAGPAAAPTEEPSEEETSETAADLLAAMDSLPFHELKTRAAAILGDATPAKKVDIVAALEERAADDVIAAAAD